MNVNSENANPVNIVSDAAGSSSVNQNPSGEASGCVIVKTHQADSDTVSQKGDVAKDKTLTTNSTVNDYGSSFSDTTSSGKVTRFFTARVRSTTGKVMF